MNFLFQEWHNHLNIFLPSLITLPSMFCLVLCLWSPMSLQANRASAPSFQLMLLLLERTGTYLYVLLWIWEEATVVKKMYQEMMTNVMRIVHNYDTEQVQVSKCALRKDRQSILLLIKVQYSAFKIAILHKKPPKKQTTVLSKPLIRKHDWNSMINTAISNFQAKVLPSLYFNYSKSLGPAPRSCWLTHRESQQFSIGEMRWDVVALGSQWLHVPVLCFRQPAHSHIGFSYRVRQMLVRTPKISPGLHNLLSHL